MYSRVCTSCINKRGFHKSCISYMYERKGIHYPYKYDIPPEPENLSIFEKMRNGYRGMKEEVSLFRKEIRDKYRMRSIIISPSAENIVWKFDGTLKSRNEWVLTCDSDYDNGYSTAKLELSSRGTGIFHGVLSTELPKDGRTMIAGFCNVTTVRKLKSFKRKIKLDWAKYNSLVLKVRGDGRCYMLNILQKGPIDLFWYKAHHYVLYTRGGPYWQYVKIPFSKFAMGGRGVLQDVQSSLARSDVTNFGITICDKKNGPFSLEIDYIGVCYDMCHFEQFAYETYDMSK
ncbi:complex I intermediate-associated protein 30, mitochondrial isoform X2 [Colletes gigas]|uniref:complex I intermediate-associated protein 30, mitochondrial isoform X2 n=1 Tax=Colletes gigas TaxID=935657 RepID=UPI001C9A4B02|nr:complex I intermediate-associated protein 30, mitochondrial isoform X2 [Colletes gigas]